MQKASEHIFVVHHKVVGLKVLAGGAGWLYGQAQATAWL